MIRTKSQWRSAFNGGRDRLVCRSWGGSLELHPRWRDDRGSNRSRTTLEEPADGRLLRTRTARRPSGEKRCRGGSGQTQTGQRPQDARGRPAWVVDSVGER